MTKGVSDVVITPGQVTKLVGSVSNLKDVPLDKLKKHVITHFKGWCEGQIVEVRQEEADSFPHMLVKDSGVIVPCTQYWLQETLRGH